jgi:hypothetical protein
VSCDDARKVGKNGRVPARQRPLDVMALLAERGMLLESARGPIPNVAELVAGESIAGSWWGHPAGHEIFAAINAVADSPDVVRLRLVNGKVTLVHRRLWPALARVGDRFPSSRLAAIEEVHTSSGAHRKVETAFPAWLPADVVKTAAAMSEAEALALLPDFLSGA